MNNVATVEVLTSSSDSEASGDEISVVGYDEKSDYSDTTDKSDRNADEDYEEHVDEMSQHTTCVVEEDDENDVNDGNDDNDSDSDDEDFEFKQLNDPKVYISTAKYRNSKPGLIIKPTLDAITETSHESFNTLSHSDGRHSQNINDIECASSRKANKRSLANTGHKGQRSLSTNAETNTRKENFTKPNKTTKSNRCPNDSVSDWNTSRVEPKPKHVIKCNTTHHSGRTKTPDKKKKRISIDLLGFYEETKELHTVKSKRRHKQSGAAVNTQHEELVTADVKTQTMAKRSPKRKRKLIRARKYDMTPLPPKTKPVPLPNLETIYLLNRSKTELTSSRSSTSSLETMESFKQLKERASEYRYRHPDCVELTHLDLRKDSHGVSRANGRLGDSVERERNDRSSHMSYHVGKLPLKEAIKGVKSTSQVPAFREVPDRTPRSSRVEQIYVDLQQERRGSEYQKLTTSAREEDDWF